MPIRTMLDFNLFYVSSNLYFSNNTHQVSSCEIENCLIFCLQHILEHAKNHWHSFDLEDRTTLPGCMEALRKHICNF
jgi:hypothetical protein